MPMEKGARAFIGSEERLENLVADHRGGQRQISAGETLGQTEKIGRYVFVGGDDHFPEPAKGDEDLIENQMDAVFATELGDAVHETGWLELHSRRALDGRFENDASGLAGLLGEQRTQGVETRFGVRFAKLACPFAAEWRGKMLGWKTPRTKPLVEKPAIAHRHRAKRITVIRSSEADDAAFFRAAFELPELKRHFQRDLDRIGTIVAVEDLS